jgi:hypothetical protein
VENPNFSGTGMKSSVPRAFTVWFCSQFWTLGSHPHESNSGMSAKSCSGVPALRSAERFEDGGEILTASATRSAISPTSPKIISL